VTALGTKSDPFQQSTCQQLPVVRGAGGRGEALRCAAPPKGEQGVMEPLGRFFRFLSLDGPRPCRRPLPKACMDFDIFWGLLFEGPFGPKWTPKRPQRAPKNADNLLKCSPGPLQRGSGDAVWKKLPPRVSPRPPHMPPVQ